jgi:uncharacterized protein YbjT (DUF2867 family)
MILVTGATGTIGRPLLDLLMAQGAAVRAVTRTTNASLPDNIDVVVGNPAQPATIAAAFDGVTSLFLHPSAIGDAAEELLRLAAKNGTERVVLLSALAVGLEVYADNPVTLHHRHLELLVADSGIPAVVLRPGTFAANLLTQWAGQVRAGDAVRGPFAASADAPIHEHDVAEVAARALLGGVEPSFVEMTGPVSMTRAQMVTTIGEAIGRPLHYEEINPEAARIGMIGRGMPPAMVDVLLDFLAAGVGRPAILADGVEQVLGRSASSLAQWASDHAPDFQ